MFDLLIKNGKIIDGTGSPYYRADLAVKDGKIVKIGKDLGDAVKVIDASGLCVTPGFIDSHSHSDAQIFTYPGQKEKVEQGITTCIAGQCGGSISPVPENDKREDHDEIEGLGNTYDLCLTAESFKKAVTGWKMGCNIAMLIGHGTLRRVAMGMEDRKPTEAELEKMKTMLREAMESGAPGLSFGLYYAPGSYATTEEAIELAKVVAEYHGIVAAHMRDEAETLVKATAEFIEIIRKSGARGVISHHKACGTSENWGKVTHTLRMIEAANEEGLEIYCDVYPYCASHSTLRATFLPNKDLAMGNEKLKKLLETPEYRQKAREFNLKLWGPEYSWVQLVNCDKTPEYKGLRATEAAKLHGKDEMDTLFDIMHDNDMNGTACYFTMCEEDLETVLRFPRAMICTDAGVAGKSTVFHPRTSASFPRTLGRYVRERKVVPLHEMIRKMTAMPARVYGLTTKGLLWEGFDADICIFDENTIIDNATFTNSVLKASGLNYVIVGGEIVCEDAVYNGTKNAKVILKESV